MKNFHIVLEHETLSKIAKLHGITVADLIKLNRLPNPNRLKIGQKIALRKEVVCGFEVLFLDADRNPIKNLEYVLEFSGKTIKGATDKDGKSQRIMTDWPSDPVRIMVKRFDGSFKKVTTVMSGYGNKLCTLVSPLVVIDTELKRHPSPKPTEHRVTNTMSHPAYGSHNPAKPTTGKKNIGPETKQASTHDGKPISVVEADIPGIDEFLDAFNGELMGDDDFAWAAKELGLEQAAIRAYAEVESGSGGFMLLGNRKAPKILYERHYFSRQTHHQFSAKYHDISLPTGYYVPKVKYVLANDAEKDNKKQAGGPVSHDVEYYRPIRKSDTSLVKASAVSLEELIKSGKATPQTDRYLLGIQNYKRLAKAYQLAKANLGDGSAALESCSWGAFQIMGENWKRMGYASVSAFTKAMSRSEKEQLKAFVLYIKHVKPQIIAYIKKEQWAKAAEAFNGPSYKQNNYDVLLKNAYKKYRDSK